MMYTGNGIYDYITEKGLDYFFCADGTWLLIYGDERSTPKLLALVCEVDDIYKRPGTPEERGARAAAGVANCLGLPLVLVRFTAGGERLMVWQSRTGRWERMTYDELRGVYESFGVVRQGTAGKRVNQYLSSSYHSWQRQSLGPVTVSDLDLIRLRNGEAAEMIELKRSRVGLSSWTPYTDDYPNFALIINAIAGSGSEIPFTLYYDLMPDGPAGRRREDISRIKVFDFAIPRGLIDAQEVKYSLRGVFTPEELLG